MTPGRRARLQDRSARRRGLEWTQAKAGGELWGLGGSVCEDDGSCQSRWLACTFSQQGVPWGGHMLTGCPGWRGVALCKPPWGAMLWSNFLEIELNPFVLYTQPPATLQNLVRSAFERGGQEQGREGWGYLRSAGASREKLRPLIIAPVSQRPQRRCGCKKSFLSVPPCGHTRPVPHLR